MLAPATDRLYLLLLLLLPQVYLLLLLLLQVYLLLLRLLLPQVYLLQLLLLLPQVVVVAVVVLRCRQRAVARHQQQQLWWPSKY